MEWKDDIVEEVRRVRDEYAARFDYDISRICKDLRKRQHERKMREEAAGVPKAVSNESAEV